MTAIPPVAVAPPGFAAKQGHQTQLDQNSARLLTLAKVLASFTHPVPGRKVDTFQLFTIFISLARGIDFAVASNEIPAKATELYVCFKQLCQPKNDSLLQSANVVVVLSIKNACKAGWFTDKETQELLQLVNEVESSFCNAGGIDRGLGTLQRNISDIMSRYYPSMKMGNILAYMEAKPGYQALMNDFHISTNEVKSAEDKLWLFVAQIDNIETSACIVNPQEVNFLVNGKGVEKRINVYMDSGPQLPTSLTTMLKYGTNLIQAVGQFNGHYIIAVAFMSVVSLPNPPTLSDYVHSDLPAPDSDPDLIEGPSRITLRCPISRARIKIPVKGAACKHLQCFDFDNYVDINTRRPSWRCPHCNQHVCYTEIRIDRNMVKVLQEVSGDISEVIISTEGSWKAVLQSDDSVDRGHDKIPNVPRDGSQQEEPTTVSNAASGVLDLTQDLNAMDVDAFQMEDMKPSLVALQNQSTPVNLAGRSEPNNATGVNQGAEPWVQDDFWADLMVNGSDAQAAVGVSVPATNMHLQQSQSVNPASNPAPQMQFRHTTRIPNASQPPPTLSHTTPQQRPVTGSYTHTPTSQSFHPTTPSTNGFAMTPPPSQNHSVAQNWNQQNRSFIPNQSQVGVPASSQLPNTHRLPAVNQQPVQQRFSQNRNHLPHLAQSPPPQPWQQIRAQGTGNNQYSPLSATHLNIHEALVRGRTLSGNSDWMRAQAAQQSQRGTTPEMPSDPNWRPANRMRGSLTDRDYPSHLREYIIHPTQLQANGPPNVRPPVVPPGLQPYFENDGNFRLPQHNPMTGPAGIDENSEGML